MDGPIDWWWKMNLLNACIQAGFCQIWSHNILIYTHALSKNTKHLIIDGQVCFHRRLFANAAEQ